MKKSGIIIAILIIIIIGLLAYIFKGGITLYDKGETENKGVLVLDDVNIELEGKLENVILKIRNTSSNVINNKTPVLIYYDKSGMPIHEAWGARVGYFAPGEERCIMFYDVISDYTKVEVGFFEREDEIQYTDLRDKIIFDVEKETEPDENEETKIIFKGENKYDKGVVATFEIDYYSGDKLIYSDDFIEVIDGNSSFDTYEYYATKFENGNDFPEGYTYEAKLVEAIELEDNSSEMSDKDYYEKAVEFVKEKKEKEEDHINTKQDYKKFIDYEGFGVGEENGKKYAYMWIGDISYYREDGKMEQGSGSSTAYKVEFDEDGEVVSDENPTDGDGQEKAVKDMIQTDVANKILRYNFDFSKMDKEAKEYYKN